MSDRPALRSSETSLVAAAPLPLLLPAPTRTATAAWAAAAVNMAAARGPALARSTPDGELSRASRKCWRQVLSCSALSALVLP
jgi:hypothetical protein